MAENVVDIALNIYKAVYCNRIRSLAASYAELSGMEIYKSQFESSGSTVHIIMPGSSVLDSIKLIERRDVVLGFNLSSLLPIKFDKIFIENCNSSDYSCLQFLSCELHARQNETETLLKNLWIKSRYTKEQMDRYVGFGRLVVDVPLRPRAIGSSTLVKKWALNSNLAFSSFFSSTLFALNYVYCSGFKNVVLHGVDFGGAYFWEKTRDLCITDERLCLLTSAPVHSTQTGKNPFSKMIVEIILAFREVGINISAANRYSELGRAIK